MSMETLGIIGYGAQAQAWAANLRDAGEAPVIFLREGSPRWEDVKNDALTPLPLGSQLERYRHFALLTPDHTHAPSLKAWSQYLPSHSLIILAHGLSFIKDGLAENFPQLDFTLLAPKAIAGEVRRRCQEGEKLGGALSLEGVHSENMPEHEEFLRTLAPKIGLTMLVNTTFREEACADLFSEQGLLCSALPYMALHSYNKLREKGHSKEIAYMECWMEVKLIADTMVEIGPKKFFELISPMALVGGELAREKLLDKAYFEKLENLYKDIDSGDFFRQAETIDVQQMQKRILSFWENQELTQTHRELRSQL